MAVDYFDRPGNEIADPRIEALILGNFRRLNAYAGRLFDESADLHRSAMTSLRDFEMTVTGAEDWAKPDRVRSAVKLAEVRQRAAQLQDEWAQYRDRLPSSWWA